MKDCYVLCVCGSTVQHPPAHANIYSRFSPGVVSWVRFVVPSEVFNFECRTFRTETRRMNIAGAVLEIPCRRTSSPLMAFLETVISLLG